MAALKKERENDAWDMWLTLYPKMNKDNFTNFEDFKKQVLKPITKATVKTSEEIVAELLPVIQAHEMTQNKRSLD